MASIAMSPAPAADIPDWLKNTTDRLTNTPDPLANVVPPMDNVPEAPHAEEAATPVTPPASETTSITTPEAALPDWLVGSNVTESAPIEAVSSLESQEETYTETFEDNASEAPLSHTSEEIVDTSESETADVSVNSGYISTPETSTSMFE